MEPSTFDVTINKSDENTKFDEKQLLTFVPKTQQKNAKELLKQFDLRSNELTWNSSGIIFIDQTSVPNSNIFLIFPHLFKARGKSTSKNIIGFDEFVYKIHEMGLDDLILHPNIKKQESENKFGEGKNKEPSTATKIAFG